MPQQTDLAAEVLLANAGTFFGLVRGTVPRWSLIVMPLVSVAGWALARRWAPIGVAQELMPFLLLFLIWLSRPLVTSLTGYLNGKGTSISEFLKMTLLFPLITLEFSTYSAAPYGLLITTAVLLTAGIVSATSKARRGEGAG